VLQDFSFMGHYPKLGTNIRFMILGMSPRSRPKDRSLVMWGLQYVFVTRLGIRRAFLPMVLGVDVV
jgi:hypothetical protein